MEQLRAKQVDFSAQHHIAFDLFHQICMTDKFTYHTQCVPDAVQLVAVTISNLQRLEVILSQTEVFNKDEIEQFRNTVKGRVYGLLNQVTIWLLRALSVTLCVGRSRELAVSILLLFFMVALWNRAHHYIFMLWFVLSFLLLFFLA